MLQESMTFKSISTSGTASSKASSLFDLDERGTKSILVYKYRSGAKGLEVKTERGLCEELDHGTSPARLSIHPSLTQHLFRPLITLHPRHQEAYTSRKQSARHPR
jgi:hypothetical protein